MSAPMTLAKFSAPLRLCAITLLLSGCVSTQPDPVDIAFRSRVSSVAFTAQDTYTNGQTTNTAGGGMTLNLRDPAKEGLAK